LGRECFRGTGGRGDWLCSCLDWRLFAHVLRLLVGSESFVGRGLRDGRSTRWFVELLGDYCAALSLAFLLSLEAILLLALELFPVGVDVARFLWCTIEYGHIKHTELASCIRLDFASGAPTVRRCVAEESAGRQASITGDGLTSAPGADGRPPVIPQRWPTNSALIS